MEKIPPRRFNIESIDSKNMVINFIPEKYINPSNDMERAIAKETKELWEEAPRITFTFDGAFLKMNEPAADESFVMQRAAPFKRQ